jgi:hypothetical protein
MQTFFSFWLHKSAGRRQTEIPSWAQAAEQELWKIILSILETSDGGHRDHTYPALPPAFPIEQSLEALTLAPAVASSQAPAPAANAGNNAGSSRMFDTFPQGLGQVLRLAPAAPSRGRSALPPSSIPDITAVVAGKVRDALKAVSQASQIAETLPPLQVVCRPPPVLPAWPLLPPIDVGSFCSLNSLSYFFNRLIVRHDSLRKMRRTSHATLTLGRKEAFGHNRSSEASLSTPMMKPVPS